eukprot:866678-Amorphochlora_amoeboformis.AAC.1
MQPTEAIIDYGLATDTPGNSQAVHSGNFYDLESIFGKSSGSVTWRDVTLSYDIYLEARYYRVLPGTIGKAISEQSPGSPAISSYP